MKKFIFLIAVCSILTGCIQSPTPGCLYMNFQIIKFEDPSHKDYVLARTGTTCFFLHADYFAPELYLGESPYIDLGDGYLLTNWYVRYPFYPTPNESVPYLLNVRWNDDKLYEFYPRWPYDSIDSADILVRHPNAEVYEISWRDIDKYFGTKLTYMLPEEYREWDGGMRSETFYGYDPTYAFMRKNHPAFLLYDSIGHVYIDKIFQLQEKGELFNVAKKRNTIDDFSSIDCYEYYFEHKED